MIAKVFDFKDIQKAHEYMEGNQANGKIVIKLDEDGN